MVSKKKYSFSVKVWLYPGGNAAWHFASVPRLTSEEIKKKYGAHARGWGSLPVSVTIGETTWATSIFPDKKSGTYILPLKANVRRSEGLDAGDTAEIAITLL
ncbi:MAG: DUF1905 domain-containing protein [Patescibacteria group bacterium]